MTTNEPGFVRQPLRRRPQQPAAGVVDQVQEQAARVAETVTEHAEDAVAQVQNTARQQVDRQMERAAGQLNQVAEVLEQAGGELRDRRQELVADQIERVARGTRGASTYLLEHSPDEVLGEVRQHAQRRPALVMGLAITLGFLGARFLRAGSSTAPASPETSLGAPAPGLPVGAGTPFAPPQTLAQQPLTPGRAAVRSSNL